jgi:tetratricopeptide (TPR) repeat protein
MAMKGPTPLAHEVATEAYINVGDYDGAIAEAEKAIHLDYNDPNANFAMGQALVAAGRHSEAVNSFKKAMRLDPGYQDTLEYGLGKAYFFMSQFEQSMVSFERAYKSNPNNVTPLWYLPAVYAHLGRQQEAETALAKLKEINPQYSKLYYLRLGLAGMFKDPEDLKRLADGLRKAGMK